MQLSSSDDAATRIGETIGSIIALAIYAGLFVVLVINFFYH
jgi:hypothetical protein